jgi:hypothetical protein
VAKFSFEKPCSVLCEGGTDLWFLRRLAANRGLDAHLGVFFPSRDGKDYGQAYGSGGFKSGLNTIATQLSIHERVRGVIVVADNDDNPSEKFTAVCDALRAARFPAPNAPEQIVQGQVEGRNLSLAVFMIPGNGREGCLESLLYESLSLADRERCVDALAMCFGVQVDGNTWRVHKTHEARLRAVVGCLYPRDPGRALGHILADTDYCPFDFASNNFDYMERFFRTFLTRLGVTL